MEQEPKYDQIDLTKYPVDERGYVDFGDLVRGELGMQSQYASRYVSGLDRPKLSDGLRIEGDARDYHNLKIHQDDAAEFIRRVQEYRKAQNI